MKHLLLALFSLWAVVGCVDKPKSKVIILGVAVGHGIPNIAPGVIAEDYKQEWIWESMPKGYGGTAGFKAGTILLRSDTAKLHEITFGNHGEIKGMLYFLTSAYQGTGDWKDLQALLTGDNNRWLAYKKFGKWHILHPQEAMELLSKFAKPH